MSSTPPYVELHCHSAYSFLDGVSLPQELAQRAGELGYTTLALTDHNSVSGSMELAQAVADHGVRAIQGAEIDVVLGRTSGDAEPAGGAAVAGGTRHLTLLVRNEHGWSNLCRIITLAHQHTRDSASRRERTEPWVDVQAVIDHADGLVCLTGCAERSVLGRGVDGEGTAERLLDAFGPEGLYVELQRPYARDDRARNRALAARARRLGVRCVATGNVHTHARARAELQDAFVALAHHAALDACEPLRRGNHSHVMSTPRAMASRFSDHPDAVRQTLLLSEQLTFDLTRDLGYRYPGAEDESSSRRLAELCRARLDERYGGDGAHSRVRARGSRPARGARAEARARLEEELRVIDRLGLAGFFLLHHDMLELAREIAVEVRGADSVRALLAPGRGRGSSVSSIVCYLTGLSHIDPIAGKLALGRFLHEDLHGLPDIDLDFPRDIRERLIPRVHERYGRDRAALVAAFPTFRARGAIRELGKVLGLPAGEIERAARGAEPNDLKAHPPAESIARRGSSSPRWRWLSHLVEQAYGLPRHLSQHPGGMVIATRPLIDCCPVVPAAMEGRQMVQWDKDSCADAGFLKIDLLGLGMLSAVERCVEEIARVRGERVDLSRIPFDDPQTFKAIRAADTVGVFQIESRAQMQSIRRTQPENLDDLVVQVAIVRPGPIQGGAINPYIERRRRLREDPGYEIPYLHPTLEPVLRETLGTIIFQDQVMQVAEAFAGFSAGEADGLRRAMSRKRSHEMIQGHRERFVTGAIRHAGPDRHDGGARLGDGRGLRRLRLSQGAQRRLRPARLPIDLAAGPLRRGVPVRALERAADGLLRPGQPRPRGRKPRYRGSGTRRERLASAVHGRARRRAPGARLHQGCCACGDAGAGGRARAGRAVRRPRRARRARRLQARDARAAGLVGRLRRPAHRRAGDRRTALWQMGMADGRRAEHEAPRARGAPSWRCRWSCPRRRGCARSDAGSG